MDYVVCEVTEVYQIGTKTPDFIVEPKEPIKLRNLSKGKEIMLNSDIRIEGKGVVSSNYQSVHFGVSMTLKDVDAEQAAEYMDMLQSQVGDRLSIMKPEADALLEQLLGDR